VLAVEVENVSKRFRRQTVQPYTTLKSAVVDFLLRRGRPVAEGTFQALEGISFNVHQGQTLGIIGRNGSGKSTLLKLLAGIYQPDKGSIAVHGRVGALLDLGAGFHPEFSGRENILINGIVLGLSKREVRQRFEAIVRFAELEEFIDEPLKTYSSGMYMRLGFAVAAYADPDILLIDEFLAVGDEAFQQKCFDKIVEFRRRGKTLLIVTHDLSTVERWCDEALWIGEGVIRGRGKPRHVIDLYHGGMAAPDQAAPSPGPHQIDMTMPVEHAMERPQRWGSREIEIVGVQMLDTTDQERYVYANAEGVRLRIHYKVHRHLDEPAFGIAIIRDDGLWCYGTNTNIEGLSIPALDGDGTVDCLLERLDLIAGTYHLDVAIQGRDNATSDYQHGLYSFTMQSQLAEVGVFRIPHRWIINP
jgi:homopolymeric O-antigen transport system ATP-binding protein